MYILKEITYNSSKNKLYRIRETMVVWYFLQRHTFRFVILICIMRRFYSIHEYIKLHMKRMSGKELLIPSAKRNYTVYMILKCCGELGHWQTFHVSSHWHTVDVSSPGQTFHVSSPWQTVNVSSPWQTFTVYVNMFCCLPFFHFFLVIL